MSDISPDAPEAEVPAEVPDPSTEGGATESQPGEGEKVDIATLPKAAQDYIQELRDENRDRRKANEPYKKAFSEYNESENDYLLNLITTIAGDTEANGRPGAKAMVALGERMQGIEAEAEAAVVDPDVQEKAAEAGMTKDDLVAMVRQEMNQEKMFADIEAETVALGFTPGTPEASKLWDTAVALDEEDLSKVAPLVRTALGLDDPVAPEPEPEPKTSAVFPATVASNTNSGDTNSGEKTTPHKIGSDELRAQVLRRIEAANKPG